MDSPSVRDSADANGVRSRGGAALFDALSANGRVTPETEVVDGEIVSGSQYRPSRDPYLPEALLSFARQVVSLWTPAAVFVLDVARADRAWKIVECNCFDGSGFYAADVPAVVRAVSAYQERRWARCATRDSV